MNLTRHWGATNGAEVIVMLAGCLAAASCTSKAVPPAAAQPPAVTVERPVKRQIVDWDEYVGRVAPAESVEVRSEMTGFLESIHFTDGQIVKKGDLLFVIDQRPVVAALEQARASVLEANGRLTEARAQVLQAKAQLAQAKAIQTKTQLDVERFKPLAKEQAISSQDLDNAEQANLAAKAEVEAAGARIETAAAAGTAAEASVTAAKARVSAAEVNLSFSRITAPLTGRIGRHMVSVGNLVSGGSAQSTLLTTIVQLAPVAVYFEADERAYLKYVRMARSGERPSSREVRNPVEVALADEQEFRHKGVMDFVENRLDVNTSTVQGRASMPNPGLELTPGLFVRLRLIGSGKYDAVLIPAEAVGSNQGQKFVYSVNGANEAEMRPVELGRMVDGLRVVHKGIDASDRIIVAGLQRVRPGAKVTPTERAAKPVQDSGTASQEPKK